MADLESHNNGARNYLTAQLQLKDGYTAWVLAADAQLTFKSPNFVSVDPAAARNMDLPGITENISDTDGLIFFIRNTGDVASEIVTVRNPADASVGTVEPGQTGIFMGSGAQAYVFMGAMTSAFVNAYFTTETPIGALNALAVQIGGDTDATFNFTSDNYVADDDALYAAIDKLDIALAATDLAAAAETVQLDNIRSLMQPMYVAGVWGIDVDGAFTNGGGLVGADALLTEQVAALCKIEDAASFANIADSAAEGGYAGAYQLLPDAPVAATDYVYFGGAIEFAEIAVNMTATVQTYDAAGVMSWEYWNGAWVTLTIANDGSSGSTADGTLAFGRDGAICFYPPADWATTTIDSQLAFWVRAGVLGGKAANVTQVGLLDAAEHSIVTPADPWTSTVLGSIIKIRAISGATTLPGGSTKFVLINTTTGARTAELEWTTAKQTDAWTISVAVADGDVCAVYCTAEAGANEHVNVVFELEISAT